MAEVELTIPTPHGDITLPLAQALRVGQAIQEMGVEKGFPPGEDDHRLPQPGQIGKQSQALVRGQLPGIGSRGGRGPAVETRQVAAPGHLPGQQTQGRDWLIGISHH